MKTYKFTKQQTELAVAFVTASVLAAAEPQSILVSGPEFRRARLLFSLVHSRLPPAVDLYRDVNALTLSYCGRNTLTAVPSMCLDLDLRQPDVVVLIDQDQV